MNIKEAIKENADMYLAGWGLFIGLPYGLSLIAGNSFEAVLWYTIPSTLVYTVLFYAVASRGR